jgi:hypothetical protein
LPFWYLGYFFWKLDFTISERVGFDHAGARSRACVMRFSDVKSFGATRKAFPIDRPPTASFFPIFSVLLLRP